MEKRIEPREEREKEEEVRNKDEGEVFYRSHPIAEPFGQRVPVVATGLGFLLERIVWWIAGIIEIILFLRIVQAVLGVEGGNFFTSFIYGVSRPLVAPFFTLFDNLGQLSINNARFEYETLAAMVVYYIVAYIVVQLIRIFRTT